MLKKNCSLRAGNEPVPAPAQAVAANFANALAPGVNSLTQSLMELIPSPPPPPPPPTVIQALAPLEQVGVAPVPCMCAHVVCLALACSDFACSSPRQQKEKSC